MLGTIQTNYSYSERHQQRVVEEIKQVGVSRLGLLRLESRYLPHVIHPKEHINGVVYGHNGEGSVMLIATDRRLIFLNKKPLFVNQDEISYFVVSGVKLSQAAFGGTVILHTRVKDYIVHTFNLNAAQKFVRFIESRCLEHEERNSYDNYPTFGFL